MFLNLMSQIQDPLVLMSGNPQAQAEDGQRVAQPQPLPEALKGSLGGREIECVCLRQRK